jgi:hypothetical protein
VESPEWSRPVRPNDSASRYGPPDDPAYEGFHTYATSDLYDTNGGVERWPDNWSSIPAEEQSREEDDDDRETSKRDYWAALVWTMAWFGVPLLIIVIRALTQSGSLDAACAEAALGGCSSPRAQALAGLIDNAPVWLGALMAALALTTVLRWASDSWRSVTIGFCAAVVAGGAVTVLHQIW